MVGEFYSWRQIKAEETGEAGEAALMQAEQEIAEEQRAGCNRRAPPKAEVWALGGLHGLRYKITARGVSEVCR